MFAQERLNDIKKIVQKRRRLSFSELQAMFKVSPATLRRDLTELEKSGDVIRVHGGVLDPGYVRAEISFDERLLRHSQAKKAIAAGAAALIPAGATVFIDAGSTCLEAGKLLLGRKDVRVITHSVALAGHALHAPAELLCIGGELRKVSGALIGARALGSLDAIRADIALIGASGADPEGCSTTEVSEAEMKKAILDRARRRILLADASKWRQPSTVRFAGWRDFTDWVTEGPLPPKDRQFLKSLQVSLHRAKER